VNDLSGRTILVSRLISNTDGQVQLDLSHLSPGIYILSAFSSEGDAAYHKVIKE
jgi:hypothetical protein